MPAARCLWTAPANGGAAITDYVLERRRGGGAWGRVNPAGTGLSYVDTAAVSGDEYRVAAVNTAGQGAWSTVVPWGPTIHLWASPTGNDTTGTGTEANPFATPQKLADTLTAGQVGALKAGTYAVPADTTILTMATAGTSASNRTRIIGAPGEARPVLRGRVYLNASWTSLEGVYIDLGLTTNATTNGVAIGLGRANLSITGPQIKDCVIDGGDSDTQGLLIGGSSYPCNDISVVGNVFKRIVGLDGGFPAGHGIYHQRGDGGVIAGNIFYLIGVAGTGVGDRAIQLYPRTTNITVEHNTIDQCSGGIVYGNDSGDGVPSGGHVVRHNLFTNLVNSAGGGGRAAFSMVGVVSPTVTADGNVFFNNVNGDGLSTASTTFTNSITATDPLYVNRTSRDYHLQAGSTVPTKGAYASTTPPLGGAAGPVP